MTTVSKTKTSFDEKKEEAQLKALVQDTLAQAKIMGASQAEVGAGSDNGFSVNVRLGEVDTVEFQRDKSLAVTVYFGKRKGSASTSDTSKEAIMQSLQAACDIAKYTSEDSCNGLADKELMADRYPDIDAYHPWSIDPEQAIELAKSCEAKAMAEDTRIKNSEGATVSSHAGVHVYGNSHGFLGSIPNTRHNMYCVLVAEDASGMQRDYEYSAARDPLDLMSIETIAKAAAHKTVSRLQSKPIKTQSTPVIFAADVAKGLFSSLVSAVSGGNLYRQSSFLLDSLGQQILPTWLSLVEKPHMKKAMGSAPFDSEGVLTVERPLVANGILEHYVLGSYSARKLGLKTTANAGGVNNLIVTPDESLSFMELLSKMDRGLLVTELIGHGINLVTGDYSQGAAGFWVEKGKISHSVEEITIANNLRHMFMGIEAVAEDIDVRSNIRTGSVLIDKMMVAGV